MLEDIVKSEVKLIEDEKWKFDFRKNGYVAVSRMIGDEKDWKQYLHAPNVESCIHYIYSNFDRSIAEKRYDEIKDAS